jgi:glutamyl-tRNA synthetase
MNKDNMSSKVRVRFAPSPTGGLHIGGLRTAILNYLFAKKHGGDFLLRIEDTDRTRFVDTAENYIKEALEWVGIVPDESPWKGGPHAPYRQSERDYKPFIDELIAKGGAYYAFDTSEELDAARGGRQDWSYNRQTRMNMKNSFTMSKEEVEAKLNAGVPYVVRFNTPDNKTVNFTDIVRGDVSFNSNQTDDKVLIKSDGIPTYHFANICDDHNMEITHVIRGEEWLPSTPLHIMLYEAFGWKAPEFAHLPLLLNPDGKGKLSKRKANEYGIPVFPLDWAQTDENGVTNINVGFKGKGYESDAIVNFLCLLGWSPRDNREVMSMNELIDAFSLDGIQKAGAKFDIKKAEWFNQQYLKNVSSTDVLVSVSEELKSKYSKEDLEKIAELSKERSVFRSDFKSYLDIFFAMPKTNFNKIDEKGKLVISAEDYENFKKVFSQFTEDANNVEWKGDVIKQKIHDICDKMGIKMGKVMPSLRMALAGGVSGPDLMTTSQILGKDETINRLKAAL